MIAIVLEMDEDTKLTLRIIRAGLDLGQEVEEEINWEDVKPVGVDIDTILDNLYVYSLSFKEKVYKKFMKSKEIIQEILPANRTAWNLYSRVGTDQLCMSFIMF